MELEVFAGQEKSELSMIEVARAILETRGRHHEMYFNDLVNEIQNYLEKSNSDIREALPLFYTELNVDGSFIPLGDNKWGLRSWYAIDEVDEEIITLEEDDEETPKKRKKKRVNAFMDGDENAIDYNDDDPEDEDLDNDYDDEDDEGSHELKQYTKDLDDIDDGDDPEDELADGIEGQLTEFSDADLDEENQD